MPKIEGELIPCQRGYHLCRPGGLIEWLGPVIYEAEYRGEMIEKDPGVVVVREARLLRKITTWNDRTARLFACDCADRALKIFEKAYPKDTRPRQAIALAREFTNSGATKEALAAAWDAAWDAAGDAERQWQADHLRELLEEQS